MDSIKIETNDHEMIEFSSNKRILAVICFLGLLSEITMTIWVLFFALAN